MDSEKIMWILLYLVMLFVNVIAWLIVVDAITATPIGALWKTLVSFFAHKFFVFSRLSFLVVFLVSFVI